MSDNFKAYQDQLEKLDDGIEKIDLLNLYAWELSRIKTQEAHKLAFQAQNLSQQLEYEHGMAESLRTVGQCHWLMGNYTASLTNCEKSIDLFQKIGEKKGEADVLNLIGGIYSKMGDSLNAKLNFKKALNLRRDIGDMLGCAKSMNSLGDTQMKERDYQSALNTFEECLSIEHESKMYRGIILYNIAETNFHLKNIEQSREYILQCREIGRELDFDLMEVYSLSLIAKIKLFENNVEESIQDLKSALRIAQRIQAMERVYNILRDLSEAHEKNGDLKNALNTYKEYQEVKEMVLDESSAEKIKSLEYKHEMQRVKNEAAIERKKNLELLQAYEKIEIQRNEILASIKYAERIQHAIMPKEALIRESVPNSFVMYRPKDVLSGDFYWFSDVINNREERLIVLAVADCTGHGVPGALMSIVGSNFLRICEHEESVNSPADALDFVNQGVFDTLRQTIEESTIKDGMDMAMVAIDFPNQKFYFAGAKNPVYIVRNNELIEIKGDKHPIGAFVGEELKKFKDHEIEYQIGDRLYLFSDGYADQFGGEFHKKLKYKRFKEKILSTCHLSMHEQGKEIEAFFDEWRGDLEQIDDVCVVGIEIDQ